MSKTQSNGVELFAYISWKTRERKPILACDEAQQAAYEAVKTRTRTHLCQILAIGGTNTEVHIVVRFPASLPVSQIARMSMQTSGEAISQLFITIHSQRIDAESVWEKDFNVKTLNPHEGKNAPAFLRKAIEDAALEISK